MGHVCPNFQCQAKVKCQAKQHCGSIMLRTTFLWRFSVSDAARQRGPGPAKARVMQRRARCKRSDREGKVRDPTYAGTRAQAHFRPRPLPHAKLCSLHQQLYPRIMAREKGGIKSHSALAWIQYPFGFWCNTRGGAVVRMAICTCGGGD